MGKSRISSHKKSKRKRSVSRSPTKKPKIQSEQGESSDSSTLTKQTQTRSKTREDIPWAPSDTLELINKIEENIPQNDSLSYHTRLEKIDWNKITIRNRPIKECQKVWSDLLKQARKFRLLIEIVEDIKVQVTKPKTKPRRESISHPDKPKQPFNNFMFFTEEKRKEVMKQHPGMSTQDIARELGQIFKNLSPEEREKYDVLAELAKKEYAEQLQKFYEKHPDLVPGKSGAKRRQSGVATSEDEEGDNPPERPKTPFQLFITLEAEKEGMDTKKAVFIQKCRERWNEIRDRDKLFWINWAEEQFDKYIKDLKEYIKRHPRFEPPNVVDILTKNEKRIKARCLGKPDKPPHGPYQLFTKMMMDNDEIKRIHPREAMSYISEKWRSCSEEEKNEYKIRVTQMWDEYRNKLAKYLVTVPSEERDRIEEEEKPKKDLEIKDSKVSKPELPPMTAYKYFLSLYTGKENPAVVWKNMSEEDKKTYEERLKAKKRNYIIMYEQYLKSLSKDEIQKMAESLTDKYDTSSDSELGEDEETEDS